MVDYTKPLACVIGGKQIAASFVRMQFGGAMVYVYSRDGMTEGGKSGLEADDAGMWRGVFAADGNVIAGWFSPVADAKIVNVPASILPDYIDPTSGKVIARTELDCRRREQAGYARGLAESGGGGDPITDVFVTVKRKSGRSDNLGGLRV